MLKTIGTHIKINLNILNIYFKNINIQESAIIFFFKSKYTCMNYIYMYMNTNNIRLKIDLKTIFYF